jgi:pimeloyl-ACP methyl ester carboxylesterase
MQLLDTTTIAAVGSPEGVGIMAKDFIIDAESVYVNLPLEKLRIPKESIDMMGYSFGGAVSAQVKAMHPECTGNYVNDRSFTAITDVAKIRVQSKIISHLAYGLMNILGWGILNTRQSAGKKSSPELSIIFSIRKIKLLQASLTDTRKCHVLVIFIPWTYQSALC